MRALPPTIPQTTTPDRRRKTSTSSINTLIYSYSGARPSDRPVKAPHRSSAWASRPAQGPTVFFTPFVFAPASRLQHYAPTASPPLSTAPSERRESNQYTTTPPHATGRPARPPAAADVARDRMIFLKPLSLSLICHLRRAPPRLASHPPSLRIEHSPSRAAPRRQPSCRQSPHARCTIFVPSSPVALYVRFVYPSFRPVLFVFVFVFFRDLGRTRPPTPVLP